MLPKVDWAHHVAEFQKSGLKITDYCQTAGVNLGTFRHYLYKLRASKPKKKFSEFPVASELVISKDPRGELSLHGLDVVQLSAILGAWSDALPQ